MLFSNISVTLVIRIVTIEKEGFQKLCDVIFGRSIIKIANTDLVLVAEHLGNINLDEKQSAVKAGLPDSTESKRRIFDKKKS
jgi:hypothetical protein